MFGSEILDVPIGLIFIFLLLSLICSAVNEIIERFLKRRAADLELGIRELLRDPSGTTLVKALYEHPLILGLFVGDYAPGKTGPFSRFFSTGGNLPSYIPSRNFALALMDVFSGASASTPSGAAGTTTAPPPVPSASTTPEGSPNPGPSTPAPTATPQAPHPMDSLRKVLAEHPNTHTAKALLTLIDSAGQDMNQARENIEAWYNSSMDRVSGWYKRRTQTTILLLGLVVAVALNADTIAIARALSQNRAVRESIVAAAQEAAKEGAKKENDSTKETEKRDPSAELDKYLASLGNYDLPIGWEKTDKRRYPNVDGKFDPAGWAVKALGWMITALAVSLGAPFWFDLLNRVMVIRSTVKPHEKSPEEPAIDRIRR